MTSFSVRWGSFGLDISVDLSMGAQWLSGRVLVWRPRDCGFKPHQSLCVVYCSKTHSSFLSTGSTQETCPDIAEKIVDWDVKNQIKQNKKVDLSAR